MEIFRTFISLFRPLKRKKIKYFSLPVIICQSVESYFSFTEIHEQETKINTKISKFLLPKFQNEVEKSRLHL